MSQPLVERVRRHLERHPERAFTAAEIAKALREDRVRIVHHALVDLSAGRVAVSCTVMRRGKQDELFRIVGGGPQLSETPRIHESTDSTAPAARKDAQPVGVRVAKVATVAIAVEPPSWRHPRGGRPHSRQRQILDHARSIDRPFFPREIVEFVARGGDETTRDAVYSAIALLKKQGLLVLCWKARDGASTYKGRVPVYATPDVAARGRLEFDHGNGGEAGDGEAGREPAARCGDEATRPSAKKTTPEGAGGNAGPHFGLMSDGALLMRGVFRDEVTIPAHGTRALIAWFDRLAGSNLCARLLP